MTKRKISYRAAWVFQGFTAYQIIRTLATWTIIHPTQQSFFIVKCLAHIKLFPSDVIDSSGMRLHVTPNLRPIESGMWIFGIPPTAANQIIPSRQKVFKEFGYCPSDCTESLPSDGVEVFAGLLHTHLVGKQWNQKELCNPAQHHGYNFFSILSNGGSSGTTTKRERRTESWRNVSDELGYVLGIPVYSDKLYRDLLA